MTENLQAPTLEQLEISPIWLNSQDKKIFLLGE